MFLIGVYVLVSIACLGASIYQNVLLIKNYFNYDTVHKIEEKSVEGSMLTPDIIFCRDPPNFNASEDLIAGPILSWKSNLGANYDFLRQANVTIRKISTFYKVLHTYCFCFFYYLKIVLLGLL